MYNPARPEELLKEFLGDIKATRLAEHIGVSRQEILANFPSLTETDICACLAFVADRPLA